LKFDLKTNWEKARLRSAKNLNIDGNAKIGYRTRGLSCTSTLPVAPQLGNAEIVSTVEAELKASGGLTPRKSDKTKFMPECSMKRVLATLSQAIPALYASDANSGAPISYLGRWRELRVSKAKASCDLLGGFPGGD
jgi:hypothetical protein